MRPIDPPDQIPLPFFYFGWKKALSYMKSDYGIYDPLEVEEFRRNLHAKLAEIRREFSEGSYRMSKALAYFVPKSMKDGKRRARPMVQFSFRDQVAWATVMLVLGEWFDTEDEITSRIPLHLTEYRKVYPWMVRWSFNNRIKRMYQEEPDGEFKRLFVHYNHKDMYESFQWGLRNLRETRKNQFLEIRRQFGNAYYGEMDIKEFYPSLHVKKFVLEAIRARFLDLVTAQVVTESCYEKWMNLLEQMCDFSGIDFSEILKNKNDRDVVEHLMSNIKYHNKNYEANKRLSKNQFEEEITKLCAFLGETLPIGLISSGFLSNCAMTHFFDRKIDNYIINYCKENGKKLYVTRYTDDLMFIGSDDKVILEIMYKAIDLLKNMGLEPSKDKTIPDILPENSEQKQLKEKGKDKAIAVPVVKKYDQIPGSTALIEKLSQFGEQNLWGMNHERLKEFIENMLNLLETQFDEKEIREETKVSFASWRLRKAAREVLDRNLNYPAQRIKDGLRNALVRLPHKTSLIDFNVMLLFEMAKREDPQRDLEELLSCFAEENQAKTIHSSDDDLGRFGPFLRTRLLFALANHWNLLPEKYRPKVAGVICRHLGQWYVHAPTWHEKVAIYWLLSVIGADKDPGAVESGKVENEHQHVRNAYYIFQCMQRNEQYLFRKDVNGEFVSESLSLLNVILDIFQFRKSEEDNKRRELDAEAIKWIRWCWSVVEKYGDIHDPIYQQFVFSLARHCKEEIPPHGFRILLQISKDNEPCFYEVLHFFDSIIQDWLDEAADNKHIKAFIRALRDVVGDQTMDKILEMNSAIRYVCIRLENLAWIRYQVWKSKNGLRNLPQVLVPGKGKEDTEVCPSLLDWLSVTSVYSLSQVDKLTHPLTEYECLSILLQCLNSFPKSSEEYLEEQVEKFRMRNILITVNDWEKWRTSVIRESIEPNDKNSILPIKFSNQSERQLDSSWDPDWYYINNVNKYVNYIDSDNLKEETQRFKTSFVFAVLLAKLLAGGRLNGSAFHLPELLKWRGVQYVIDNCGGPSSELVHLITDTMNLFYLFYKHRYEHLGIHKIPYRPFISEDTIDLMRLKSVVAHLYEESSKRYLLWSHGLLEMRVENVDPWVEEA